MRMIADSSPFVSDACFRPLLWLGQADAFLRRRLGVSLLRPDERELAALLDVPRVHPAFGDQAPVHQLLSAFLAGCRDRPRLSAMFFLGIKAWARSCLHARRECMDYVARHPEVLEQPLARPVVIMGMHRTGTTLLYNLLHQDERTRSPFLHEMYGPWSHLPPATSRAAQYSDRRMVLLKAHFDQGRRILPEGFAKRDRAHPTTHDMIEEENVIGAHQMNWFMHIPLSDARYQRLIFDPDKDFVFKYLRIYLQVLQTGYAPASHWTLKSPSHLLHLDSFMRSFPDARVVLLHRDPKVTVPSLCYLIEALFGCYWLPESWDRRTLGPFVCELYEAMTQRLMRHRDAHPETSRQFFDLEYAGLMADPVGTVQRIYQSFGIAYPASLEDRLKDYLAQQPQHKHGKPDYTLEKYGVTAQQIDQRFAEYRDRYLSLPGGV
ncbi:MAG TPA: sulfotransferase [Pseudomonadota bacterium]|nr:sulfotransferase [Pseudomonadota bacterium]